MSTEYGLPNLGYVPEPSKRLPSEHPIDPGMRAEIMRRIDQIQDEFNVRVLYACESGSRAWGFASPDSDYDVRFIYAHQPDWYCQLDQYSDPNHRDVIEKNISDQLDLAGWDIQKVGKLMLASNPVLMEWLRSPVVYYEDPHFNRRVFKEMIAKVCTLDGSYHHYVNMARRNYREHLNGPEIRYKKYLYVIRPLLCAKWIWEGLGSPPMPLADVAEKTIDDQLLFDELSRLLARKMTLGESERTARWDYIHAFINDELARAEKRKETISDVLNSPQYDQGVRIEQVNRFLVRAIRYADL